VIHDFISNLCTKIYCWILLRIEMLRGILAENKASCDVEDEERRGNKSHDLE
jgi:hypothetical protein